MNCETCRGEFYQDQYGCPFFNCPVRRRWRWRVWPFALLGWLALCGIMWAFVG